MSLINYTLGSIILEKAAIGSLDKYLQLKCIQINQNEFDESMGKLTYNN